MSSFFLREREVYFKPQTRLYTTSAFEHATTPVKVKLVLMIAWTKPIIIQMIPEKFELNEGRTTITTTAESRSYLKHLDCEYLAF